MPLALEGSLIMAEYIILHLHPLEPKAGSEFTKDLATLTIRVFDKEFSDPGKRQIGQQIEYLSPLGNPYEPNPNTDITQHFVYEPGQLGQVGTWSTMAVATAVVELSQNDLQDEYKNSDLYFEIERDGKEIVFQRLDYNALRTNVVLPNLPQTNDFVGQPGNAYHISLDAYYETFIKLPTSAYVALTEQGREFDPNDPNSAYIQLPDDGSPPGFSDLDEAVDKVLTIDPGAGNYDLAALTQQQCLHIAREIVWDRNLDPLPEPSRPLENIYTEPPNPPSDREMLKTVAARKRFEAELQLYYVKHSGDAERLAKAIFSLSAAYWCAEKCKEAKQVRFTLPIFPDSPEPQTEVLLTGVAGAALDPAFEVPADYFYALTAVLPPRVSAEQRYKLVTMNTEARTLADIQRAWQDGILQEDGQLDEVVGGLNSSQAARRLWALGVVTSAGIPQCEVALNSPVQQLINGWLASTDEDINDYFDSLTPQQTAGHLDLILCAITDSHEDLITRIKNPPIGEVFVVNNVHDLAAKTTGNWDNLLALIPKPPEKTGPLWPVDPSLLPSFTEPGTAEERFYAFMRHLNAFFAVTVDYDPLVPSEAIPAPGLPRSPGNPLDALLTLYPAFTFANWDAGQLQNALNNIFPADPIAQGKFAGTLDCIQRMINLTNGIAPPKLQFSVIEALWARGFTSTDRIEAFSSTNFKNALAGSIAYDHAQTIWKNAHAVEPFSALSAQEFKPANPDGSIVNCVPPHHRSPLGPVAYLHELLKASKDSSCEFPLPPQLRLDHSLAAILTDRRGTLGNLIATSANLDVPLPLIDIVNESLEYIVATDTPLAPSMTRPSIRSATTS